MRGERGKGESVHCVDALSLTSKVADTGGELPVNPLSRQLL